MTNEPSRVFQILFGKLIQTFKLFHVQLQPHTYRIQYLVVGYIQRE